MQKIYENPKSRYAWNFPELDITYFEIPKTGSSSTKTALFRSNYRLNSGDELNIGGGKLALRFPDSLLQSFQPQDLLNRILIIYRDPIARAKSAYRSIFLGRQKMQGSLSEYLNQHLSAYIQSPPTDGMLNHHKPMTWFFPSELIDDPRTVFVNTENLAALPNTLGFENSPTKKSGTNMPHLLNVNKSLGEIDMTDAEIRTTLGSNYEGDFNLFERLSVVK